MNAGPDWLPLFWAGFLLAWILVLAVLVYLLGLRRLGMEKRCTGMTTGRVIRYCALGRNGISLPVVEYRVDGVSYRVVGPRFTSVRTVTTSAPGGPLVSEVESNLVPGRPLPRDLRLRVRKRFNASITPSPLIPLYPVGAPARVFFNPDRPKEAFVERWAGGESLVLWIILPALALLILGLILVLVLLV